MQPTTEVHVTDVGEPVRFTSKVDTFESQFAVGAQQMEAARVLIRKMRKKLQAKEFHELSIEDSLDDFLNVEIAVPADVGADFVTESSPTQKKGNGEHNAYVRRPASSPQRAKHEERSFIRRCSTGDDPTFADTQRPTSSPQTTKCKEQIFKDSHVDGNEATLAEKELLSRRRERLRHFLARPAPAIDDTQSVPAATKTMLQRIPAHRQRYADLNKRTNGKKTESCPPSRHKKGGKQKRSASKRKPLWGKGRLTGSQELRKRNAERRKAFGKKFQNIARNQLAMEKSNQMWLKCATVPLLKLGIFQKMYYMQSLMENRGYPWKKFK